MSIKSGLFAAVATVGLMLVLGNDWVNERSADADSFAAGTRQSITGALRFQVWGDDLPSDFRGPTIVRLLLLIVLTAVFGAIVGRARPAAAFLGGWGLFLAASVISAGIYSLVLPDDYGQAPGSDAVDTFTFSASAGTALGMWLGWVVGLAVLLGSFGKGQPRADAGRPTPPPGAWNQPPAPTPGSYDASPGGYGTPAPPPPPPSYGEPGPAAPPPAPGGPVIGAPPDRTQVFGEPPRDT